MIRCPSRSHARGATVALGLGLCGASATAAGCNEPQLPPNVGPTIDGFVLADGQRFTPLPGLPDATTDGIDSNDAIPAASRNVIFYATIGGLSNRLPLVATAGGAFALANDAGTQMQTVQPASSAGATAPAVEVPLVVAAPSGYGDVHLTVGPTSIDFAFAVAPSPVSVPVVVSLCPAGADGGCMPGFSGASSSSSAGLASADACAAAVPLPQPGSTWQPGQDVLIEIQPLSAPAFPALGVVLVTGAVLASPNTDAGGNAVFEIGEGSASPLSFPAQLGGPGEAEVTVSVAGGQPQQFAFPVGGPAVAAAQVSFEEPVGVLSENVLTVCSATASGSLTASIGAGTGVLASPVVAISAADPAVCPGYPGQASFVWTGATPLVPWTFAYDGGSPVLTTLVPMIGTEVAVSAWVTSQSWNSFPDAGTNVALSLQIQRPPPVCIPDGGVDAAAACATGPVPGYQPVANAPFSLLLPPGFSAGQSAFQTDVNGAAYVTFTAPPGTEQVQGAVDVQGAVTALFCADGGL